MVVLTAYENEAVYLELPLAHEKNDILCQKTFFIEKVYLWT